MEARTAVGVNATGVPEVERLGVRTERLGVRTVGVVAEVVDTGVMTEVAETGVNTATCGHAIRLLWED